MKSELLACPFCDHKPPQDLRDTLYPSGIYRRLVPGKIFQTYVSHKDRQAGDEPCWTMHCCETAGGCGAQISADTRSEAVRKWNARAVPAAQKNSL